MAKTQFNYTGANQVFTVPAGVYYLTVKVWGAGGGYSGFGQGGSGCGGYSTGTMFVTPGQTFDVMVGGRGLGLQAGINPVYGGGGIGGLTSGGGQGSSGGGRSGVAFTGQSQFIIAGGGGGGPNNVAFSTTFAGNGGGTAGTDVVLAAGTLSPAVVLATGGSQTTGGLGATTSRTALNGFDGTSLQGGKGGPDPTGTNGGGAGGGGGYFGGGGGNACFNLRQPDETPGGGGSGFVDDTILLTSSMQSTPTATVKTLVLPPNNTDPDYVGNAGAGGNTSVAGLVVFNYTPLTLTKTVSNTSGAVGDTLTYTIVFNGDGLVYNNAIFVDTVPSNTTFVPNSLVVNGATQTGQTPNPPGISVGSIGPGATTITFSAVVTSQPSPSRIQNVGNITATSIPSVTSNVTTTTIVGAALTSTKTVNKTAASIGDTLTYTIVINNTGNTTANSIVFTDTIPNGTSLIAGTFKQDTTNITGSSNPPGVTLPNAIGALRTSTITFQVRVTTTPNPNPIPNFASMTYSFIIDSTTTPNRVGTGTTNTNTVNTQVNTVDISGSSKRVDKAFAKVGDTLLYTIVIPNTGNTSAINVILKDTIPNNTTFLANSVTINGVSQLGEVVAPPTGLSIGTLPASSVTTVTFIVTVATIPSPNPIPNSATTTYSYVTDPILGTTTTGSGNTNTVATRVNTAILGTTKTVNTANTFVDQTLTYTMVIKNTGNTTANAVQLFDTIPNGTTFVPDSVTVNGVTQVGANPQSGVNLVTLPVGGVQTVTFRVVVNTIPTPNPTPNTAITNYSYLLDSSTPTNQSATGSSNTVATFVNPNTNPLKGVNLTSATVGNTLVYAIVWNNVTSDTQTNVTFIDTIPNGVTFVPNTLTLGGVPQTGATITPPSGFNAGTLPAGQSVTITFQVLVNTIPNPNPIPNTAEVVQTSIGLTQHQTSNTVNTQINYAELSSVPKSVNRAYSTPGETVTYTIALFNNGNTSANDVVLLDTIPAGTSFVVNSVYVNGVNQPGAVVAPTTGLTLSCIPTGQVTTVTFDVLVQSIPSPNPTPNTASVSFNYTIDNVTGQTKAGNTNTNTVTTTIVDATIVSTKTVNKAYTIVGDTLTYTVVLIATGNTTANSAVFIDSLPSTLTYVPGTFAINGSLVSGANPAPPGQNIGSLTVPATYTITFNAVINTIPTTNPIQNQAQTNYTYTVEPTIANGRSRGSATNIANTTVSQASLGGITKSVDKLFADCGETITYTLAIPNSGNATATNVVFRDTIPNGTVLVANSVFVNGLQQVGASPQTGINLGSIAPGATTTVMFSVVVQC